jgi:hypothetical protein
VSSVGYYFPPTFFNELETRGVVDVLDDGSRPSQFSSKPLTPKRNEVPSQLHLL